MYELRIAEHPQKPGVKIVEVLRKGKVVATIHPAFDGVKLASQLIPKDHAEAMESGLIFFDQEGSTPVLKLKIEKLLKA